MEDAKVLEKEDVMRKAFYSPRGLWKGRAAIEKLSKEAGVDRDEAERWLSKQAIWQIFLPPPRYVPRPHWTVSVPNQVHQADLLFLPHDKVGRKTFKYALVVIDVASRFLDAEALASKSSNEVSEAFERVYSRKRGLRWPKELLVDPGREFMGTVSELMRKRGVTIRRSEAGNHRAQAFVERANRTIGERIFSLQYVDELALSKLGEGGRSRRWVERLPEIVKSINDHVTRLTGKKAIEAYYGAHVKQQKVEYLRPVGFHEKRIEGGVSVRYLLRPGEEEGGDRRRATDPVWSTKVFGLARSEIRANQPVLYYLVGGPRRGFVREELMVVPPDTAWGPGVPPWVRAEARG